MRKRISPASRSVSSCDSWLKETRAPLTTARSVASAPSSATKPWSSTGMELSATTSGVTATRSSLAGVPVGLLRALEERYGLDGLEAGERLAGGYANDIFRLDS